jgi:DNA-binding NtrC family response regulator
MSQKLTTREPIRPLKESLQEPERRIILEALRLLDWNRVETARALGIDRTTLWKKMAKYGLLRRDRSVGRAVATRCGPPPASARGRTLV